MAKLRTLIALMAVVFHLAALLMPVTAHSAAHPLAAAAVAHAPAEPGTNTPDDCCSSDGAAVAHTLDAGCETCAASCLALQAALVTPLPVALVLPAPDYAAATDQTLRPAPREASLRPPPPSPST